MYWDTESHADGVAQRGEVVPMVRLAAHAMHYDGAVWHDEQAVRVVHASVLGDHRRRPGMGGPQLLGNDVRTLDALSRISDDLRGADVDRHAHAHDAPVFRLVQGYGIRSVVFTLKVYIISYIVTADGKEYAHVSLH